MSYPYAISLSSIQEASDRIGSHVSVTPVMRCSSIDRLAGRHLYFKCECMQKTGSFKARGATNAVLKNSPHAVVTHSSGNHGQALAWAAQRLSIPAYIVMPTNAPVCKQRAVQEYGGNIRFVEPTQAAREAGAAAVQQETGATFIHPYDNPDVMSGQGTVALELLSQVENLDAIIVPIGGGGLCSGVTMAAKSLRPSIKIIAAEPELADDAYRSKMSGEKQHNAAPPLTVADGLKTNLGDHTWPIVRDMVDDIITVSDDEIRAAMRLVWERMKCVIEPSAGVGIAVALSSKFKSSWGQPDKGLEHIGVILCGGNIDLDNLSSILKTE